MSIEDIYLKYHIPINLKRHMFQVAAIGLYICDHLTDTPIDTQLVVTTLLLHDMGNILKFDLSDPKLLDTEDKPRIGELLSLQRHFRSVYGHDTDQATYKIIREVTDNEEILRLCTLSNGNNLDAIVHTEQFESKICYYSDMRVGPFGILKIHERFDDLLLRYPHATEHLTRNRTLCVQLEKQLQEHVHISLQNLNESFIRSALQRIPDYPLTI